MPGKTFDIRPHTEPGDRTPDSIFVSVGMATTAWEMLESDLGELFDALVGDRKSNRGAIGAFSQLTVSDAKGQLIRGSLRNALRRSTDAALEGEIFEFLSRVDEARARRNNIAHGVVSSLAEHGHYLHPNNTMRARWDSEGRARYQWVAEDIRYYAVQFHELRLELELYIKRTKVARPD